MLHVVQWYLVVALFGLAAWPVTAFLLPAFKDRGYAFSRTLGLMLAGFFFYLLTCFKILQNDSGGVLSSLVFVFVLGMALQTWFKAPRYTELFHSSRKTIIWVEGLFLVCFIFLAWWRSFYPDITGTEKPMELAFINSILRSTTFPPADPWLSGYSISYYYFGYIITSMLIRLSGVVSGVGFNLMAATVFSLAAVGLYGLIFNLINAEQTRRWLKFDTTNHGLPLLGPLFTLIVSNAEGLFEILYSRGLFWQKTSDGWVSSFWRWIDLQELQTYPTQSLSWWPSRPGGIIWWRASRVLSDYTLQGNFQEIIDEFPFFSFLLSDLHPHVLAIPFAVLALAFGLNLLLGGAGGSIKYKGFEVHLPVRYLLAIPVFIGGMAFMNTWDFPVYLGIFLLCYMFIRLRDEGWQAERFWEFLIAGVVLGGLSIVAYLPFFIGFKSQAGGIIPSFVFSTRGAHFWIMFGVMLAPICIFLLTLIKKTHSLMHWKKGLAYSSILLFGAWILSFILGFGAMNLPNLGQDLTNSPVPAISSLGLKMMEAGEAFSHTQGLVGETNGEALLSALLRRLVSPGTWITIWGLLSAVFIALIANDKKEESTLVKRKTEEQIADLDHEPFPAGIVFILILALVGTVIVLIPEFVYLRDQFGWRMNTIFKFYYQVWLLWSVVAAFGVIFIIRNLKGLSYWISSATISLAIMIGLIYPVFGLTYTTNSFNMDQLNLDGTAHLDIYQTDEANAMKWLQSAPYGVIAESVGGSYSAHARMSTHSGLPTVIGWTPHEGQWGRTFIEMGGRDQDITLLYNSPEWYEIKPILDRYQVRYIVIGYLEKNTYQVQEAKFSLNLPIVYHNDSVVIYEYTGSENESIQ